MRLQLSLALISILSLAACKTLNLPAAAASATLEPRSGSNVKGTITFDQSPTEVRAHVELTGLVPGSEHGFHVHEKGDCSSGDASSAGGHFNPTNLAHGKVTEKIHHSGDLPSLTADANGKVSTDIKLSGVTLGTGPTSFVGRSVVVHANADDFTTQPSGNSGARIACGVIVAK